MRFRISVTIKHVGVLASIAVAVGVAACTGQVVEPPAAAVEATGTLGGQGLIQVRAGTGSGIGQAGQVLAQSEGYFTLEGLAIDTVNVDPSNSLAAVLDGEIDVAGLGMDSGLFTSLQRGGDIRIVAPQASSVPNANGAFIVVRKDLADSGRVREFADLKGLRIAVSALGNSSEYVLAKAMDSAGLTLGDAKVVVLNVPAMVTALASKSIDVGVLNEP